VQARLRALGYPIDEEWGAFGVSTKQAVRAFQQQRQIIVDGIVGPHTWSELVEASWRLGDRGLYLKSPHMRGDDVALLQAQLNALGFDAGREDGIFGVETDQAVRAFQKEYAVVGDGIFGAHSLRALQGLRVDRPGTSARLREELALRKQRTIEGSLIVIDPGHGGDDSGDEGPSGLRETDLCWDLGMRIADRLAAAGAKVRLTRTENEGPDLSERARRANDMNADLFVSIHLNSHDEPTAEGASTYFFGTSHSGAALADLVQRALVPLGLNDCRAHARAYTVLKETRMPAVMIEPAFITNPYDEKRLNDLEFRAAIADAVTDAVASYWDARF
jgi:N-acetylmuramoyl-L-alanine amidase